MSFYREKPIKAVRKARQCMGCCKQIEVGSPALECAGHWEGDFWSGTYHAECREAECAFNKLKDYRFGDEWYPLFEIEFDDWEWLMADFPAVAERMGITSEKHADAVKRHQSFWVTPQDQPHA